MGHRLAEVRLNREALLVPGHALAVGMSVQYKRFISIFPRYHRTVFTATA